MRYKPITDHYKLIHVGTDWHFVGDWCYRRCHLCNWRMQLARRGSRVLHKPNGLHVCGVTPGSGRRGNECRPCRFSAHRHGQALRWLSLQHIFLTLLGTVRHLFLNNFSFSKPKETCLYWQQSYKLKLLSERISSCLILIVNRSVW